MDMWICPDETGPVFSWQRTVSGQTAFDKSVRPAAVWGGGETEIRKIGGIESIGVQEGADRMFEEAGHEVEGEVSWRRQTGVRKQVFLKQADAERDGRARSATHVLFRDWCTHCMIGRGRTHHHVAKQISEDQMRRATIAMDYNIMKMNSVVNAQTISEESVTCIAVKEDRRQKLMSSVALKKGVEEPWMIIERVVTFIALLGDRDVTLKSDMGMRKT